MCTLLLKVTFWMSVTPEGLEYHPLLGTCNQWLQY